MFFSQSYENQLNERVLDDVDYVVDKYGVLNYVANVIHVPYCDYLDFADCHQNACLIQPRNITQSSSFAACESEMIDVFLSEDNKGLDFVSIGRHFTKYIRSDNDQAYRKYGENQVKTCEQLGLAFEYYKHWYLNCVGYIYKELHAEDQRSLLARNILRDPLYARMMSDIRKHDVDILEYMACIKSNETKLRRYESVARLLAICLVECEREGIQTYAVINNKTELESTVKNEKKLKVKKKTDRSLFLPFPNPQLDEEETSYGYGTMAAEDKYDPETNDDKDYLRQYD